MNIESRQWKPRDLLDNLQKMIDEEPDDYCNERRWTLCTARDYLKQYFMQPDEPLVMEDFTIVGESEKQTAGGGTLMDYERLIEQLRKASADGSWNTLADLEHKAAIALTDLLEEIEQLKRERDAAIEDLEKIMFCGGRNIDTCDYCKNAKCYGRGGRDLCDPEWRGAQKEER